MPTLQKNPAARHQARQPGVIEASPRIMKHIPLLLFLLAFATLSAQEKQDPAAQKLLKEVRRHYDTPSASQIDLQLTVTLPEQKPSATKGRLIHQGARYHLDLGPQAWYCDGKTVWIHLKEQKEVQVHDAGDQGGGSAFLTPRDILDRYDSGDYTYAMQGTGTYIEFKPKDRNDEFFKLRLSVDARKPEIVRFEAFSRNGARYALDILSTVANVKVSPSRFVFDPKAHPGVAVEDLRLN